MGVIEDILENVSIDCPECKVDMQPTGFHYPLIEVMTEYKCPKCDLIQVKSAKNEFEDDL